MDEQFSQETKNLILESRNIAISLGYDHISTLHFFLADCKLNDKHSIKSFVFTTEKEFQNFFDSLKIADSTIFAESLPLTREAEQTIRKAVKLLNNKNYSHIEVYPYHLFLAASQLKDTWFYSIFETKKILHERLEQYYVGTGQIKRN